MDQAIQDFINGKRIAIVGVSRDGDKFGNTAFAELAARGYQVFAVHPEAKEIAGTPLLSQPGCPARSSGWRARRCPATTSRASPAGSSRGWIEECVAATRSRIARSFGAGA